MIKVSLPLLIVGLLVTSEAQNVQSRSVPNLNTLISSLEQNGQQFFNYKFRVVIVSSASPGYWGAPQSVATQVEGKKVRVEQTLGLVNESDIFIDQQVLTVRTSGEKPLESHNKYWKKKSGDTSYSSIEKEELLEESGEVVLANAGKVNIYEMSRGLVPATALGKMQIALKVGAKSSLRSNGARIVGWEKFRGLECVRLEWSAAKPGDFSGFSLICPERSYKQVYIEQSSDNPQAASGVRKVVDKSVIEKFVQVGNAWLPSQVFHTTTDTYVDGHQESLTDKFRLVEFNPDVVNTDLLFEPLPSPGTHVFLNGFDDNGGKMEIAGGDVSALVAQLSKGDFSILNEEVKNLSAP